MYVKLSEKNQKDEVRQLLKMFGLDYIIADNIVKKLFAEFNIVQKSNYN